VTRGFVRAAIAAVLALTVTGCGLPEDGGPQALAPENLPPDLLDPNPGTSTTLQESAGTTTVTVYILEETSGGIRLAPVEREVARAGNPDERVRARLATLFALPHDDELAAGLSTAIPADTVLRRVIVDQEADEVLIDVSGDLLTVVGDRLAQAFAQIVWTVSERGAGGYNRVRFLIDGASSTVLDGDGVVQEGAVARADYSNLTPRPDP